MTHKILKIDDIPVTVFFKDIKHLYIKIRPDGNIQVSAPRYIPEQDLIDTLLSNWNDIEQKRNKILKRLKHKKPDPLLPDDASKLLKARLQVLIPECEQLVGVKASGYRIKDMSSRWGSCSLNTRKISLNIRLANKDDDCLKMVLIHELVHFYVPNHGSTFKAYMDKFCPSWRMTNKKLQEN